MVSTAFFLVEELPSLCHACLNKTPRLWQSLVVRGLKLEEARTQCSAVLDLPQDIQRLYQKQQTGVSAKLVPKGSENVFASPEGIQATMLTGKKAMCLGQKCCYSHSSFSMRHGSG